jgi:hypothetical protein
MREMRTISVGTRPKLAVMMAEDFQSMPIDGVRKGAFQAIKWSPPYISAATDIADNLEKTDELDRNKSAGPQ